MHFSCLQIFAHSYTGDLLAASECLFTLSLFEVLFGNIKNVCNHLDGTQTWDALLVLLCSLCVLFTIILSHWWQCLVSAHFGTASIKLTHTVPASFFLVPCGHSPTNTWSSSRKDKSTANILLDFSALLKWCLDLFLCLSGLLYFQSLSN